MQLTTSYSGAKAGTKWWLPLPIFRTSHLVAWVSLSCVGIFLFDWVASGGCSLDSRALHLRFRPGDVQLLRTDQSCGAEHGLSQRAPRFAFDPMEQSAEAARDGAGILR